MFEQELEMEEKESSIVPLLMIVGLIAVVLGGVGWFVWEHMSKKDMTAADAGSLVEQVLQAQGPAVVHFHVGLIETSVDEKPFDPHYKLLEKIGVVKLGKTKGMAVPVELTPAGQRLLASIPGVDKSKNSDGTDAYTVPLATRKLVQVTKVTMRGVNLANAEYTWRWEPTELGLAFDANSKAVDSFKLWERTTLIDKYGVNFYDAQPKPATLTCTRTEKGGWKLYTEY